MMHKHGGDIYTHSNSLDFSANINMFGTPENVIKAACEGISLSAQYPDTECRELIEAIAEYEGVEKEKIICGNGAADLIFSIVIATRPRTALLLAPSFYEYEQALNIFEECTIKYEELVEEFNFELKDTVLGQINDELDIVFLCNPNNPTGNLINHILLLQIVEKCKHHDVLLVLDECFLNMVSNGEDLSLKNYLDNNNVFILKAFTKMYAMAGIRLGYGISSNQELLTKMKRVTQPWNVSIPAQYAGIAALKENHIVKQFTEALEIERKYLLEEFTKLKIKYYGSNANYIFFQADTDLYDKCLHHGILIRDCSNYNGLVKGYYRIAIRNHIENMKLIEVLNKCI